MASWWYTLFASPVVVAAVPLAQRVFDWWTRSRSENAIKKAADIYSALNDAQYRIKADRILVVSAHNCGGSIRPESLLFIDALYEVVSDMEPRLHRLTNQRIDGYFISVLQKLLTDGVFWVNREDVPAGCGMRNLYEADGIAQACLFLISTGAKNVVFGKVHFKVKRTPSGADQDTINTLRGALSNLLR